MVANNNYNSEFFEKQFSRFLDLISDVDPRISTPYLEINQDSDGLFVCQFVIKVLEPQRSVDYEQNEEPS